MQLCSLLPYRLSTGLVIPESRCAKTNSRLDQPGRVVGNLRSLIPPPGYFVPKPRMALGTQRWGVSTGGSLLRSRARKEGEGRARGPGAGQRASAPPPWPRADRTPPSLHTHQGLGRVPMPECVCGGGGTSWRREGSRRLRTGHSSVGAPGRRSSAHPEEAWRALGRRRGIGGWGGVYGRVAGVGVTLNGLGGGDPGRAPVGVVRARPEKRFPSVWLVLAWRGHNPGRQGTPGALLVHEGVEVGENRLLAE